MVPAVTLMAVSSSIAYAGPWISAAHLLCVGHGVLRQELVIQVREDREVDEAQRAVAPGGRLPPDEVRPDAGGHHHAPGAQPHVDRLAQRRQEIGQPGLPHPVAQVQGVAAATSRTSVSRTRGTQRSSSMLGSAVSSSTPKDFQPSSHMGSADRPLMNCHAPAGPTWGARTSRWGYRGRWTRRSVCPAGQPARRGCSGS